ncbi:hypothetical protein [Flavobacterium sp. JP2137]|uniref:hypothetical protein n=1 Tax=Flavobacterium sp. JP2137 TaxID=3414510 RepID=UPI003D2FAF93
MKRFIFIFLLAIMASFGACSSSDDSNPPPPPVQTKLELKASALVVNLNERVQFEVFQDSKAITDAVLAANNVVIGQEHQFTAVGEYRVIAKKANAEDSNVVIITVEEVIVANNLVLSADATQIDIEESIHFTVMHEGAVITDAELFANGVKIGYTHAFITAGTYEIIAKKANFNDSNSLRIVVISGVDPPPPPEESIYHGKWIPTTAVVSFLGSPLPGGSMPYPHKPGCPKDMMELAVYNAATFVFHSDNCEAQTTVGTWAENGDILSVPLMGVDVEAKVKRITTTTLVLEVDVYRYRDVVQLLYPDLAGFISQGMKADITFIK